jgi:hypothetical protein
VGQQQRQQFGLVYESKTQTSLQLRGSEQQLLTAWKVVCAACAILEFSASPLGRRVLAAHVFESLKRGDEAAIFKQSVKEHFQHELRLPVSENFKKI